MDNHDHVIMHYVFYDTNRGETLESVPFNTFIGSSSDQIETNATNNSEVDCLVIPIGKEYYF